MTGPGVEAVLAEVTGINREQADQMTVRQRRPAADPTRDTPAGRNRQERARIGVIEARIAWLTTRIPEYRPGNYHAQERAALRWALTRIAAAERLETPTREDTTDD